MSKMGVVIVAAGRGSRMRTSESKQYLPLAGKPILAHTMLAFASHPEIDVISMVVPPGDEPRVRELAEQYGCVDRIHIIAGGAERQHSVLRGLEALRDSVSIVLVHDGVRPFITKEKISAIGREAASYGAAVLAVPVKDTIKIAGSEGVVQSTPDRHSLWAVQTPQAFRISILIDAYGQAERDGFLGTDDASLVERLGHPVKLVLGDYTNVKITTPEDLEWAEHYYHSLERGREDVADRTRI